MKINSSQQINMIMCDEINHLTRIQEILNEAIENSTAPDDYKPGSLEDMKKWFEL